MFVFHFPKKNKFVILCIFTSLTNIPSKKSSISDADIDIDITANANAQENDGLSSKYQQKNE